MSPVARAPLAAPTWPTPLTSELPVALLDWPQDRDIRHHLVSQGTPCLLLVPTHEPPPGALTSLEDWIRLPADDAEIHARATSLHQRLALAPDLPGPPDDLVSVDAYGILRVGDAEVVLTPLEARLMEALLDPLGGVCSKARLRAAAWPDGPPPSPRVLDSRLTRLRKRIEHLPLTLHTVRGRGHLLDRTAPRPSAGDA